MVTCLVNKFADLIKGTEDVLRYLNGFRTSGANVSLHVYHDSIIRIY